MRVAVTGAAGFLGRAVVLAHLAHGDEVIAMARRDPGLDGVEGALGDLHDGDYVRAALEDVDVVQHLAARVRPIGSYEDFRRDNVTLTQRL